MRLYQLVPSQIGVFDDIAEAAMGTHMCLIGEQPAAVICGIVVASLEEADSEVSSGFLRQPWLRPDLNSEERRATFDRWFRSLPETEVTPLRYRDQVNARVNLVLRSLGLAPSTSPAAVYGHVPFPAITEPGDIFYRFEAFPPPSRRIDQINKTIKPDTFVSPPSEIPFMPTGFSAVARCALPNLAPACFRWELRPEPGTSAQCGACVPQFGQSGGGVEVVLIRSPNDDPVKRPRIPINNIGPIADPVILPAL